jgi:hypothetical protein
MKNAVLAQRMLVGRSADGTQVDIEIQIGTPYRDGEDWACPVSITPLYDRLADIHGIDSFQAVSLALRLVHRLLENFKEKGGTLSYPEGDEFVLDEDFSLDGRGLLGEEAQPTDPPIVLAGMHVIAWANSEPPVRFEQQKALSVAGHWMGQVPRLALCAGLDQPGYWVQHCSEDWAPWGVQGNCAAPEEAKERVERSYHGLEWIETGTSREEALAIREEDVRSTCSFCGREPKHRWIERGTSLICHRCIEEFHQDLQTDEE